MKKKLQLTGVLLFAIVSVSIAFIFGNAKVVISEKADNSSDFCNTPLYKNYLPITLLNSVSYFASLFFVQAS